MQFDLSQIKCVEWQQTHNEKYAGHTFLDLFVYTFKVSITLFLLFILLRQFHVFHAGIKLTMDLKLDLYS